MQAFVPKNRRPKFELVLKIVDLNNIPLVSGTSYIKWHLSSSTSAEHRGRTDKATIKDHKVTWDYEKTLQVRLTADKEGVLQSTELHFEVLQEYSAGGRGDRIVLGNVKLNLAEYVDGSEETEDGVTRRYLMQDSKINSTLKISILMKLVEGERNFIAPPLKTAPVFGGIAGIITSEQGELDEGGNAPMMSSKIAREVGELQDMYRRTLAASWCSQMDELPADKCIEDIFAGGDGWGKIKNTPSLQVENTRRHGESTEENDSDSGTLRTPTHRKQHSNFSRNAQAKHKSRGGGPTSAGNNTGHPHSSSSEEQRRKPHRRPELNELELREDLKSWEISPS